MDSPTSQYHNKGCAFLTKRLAEENDVDVIWIFTESGHGKGLMDSVGATIKNSIDNAMIAAESIPNVSVRCAADVVPILNLVTMTLAISIKLKKYYQVQKHYQLVLKKTWYFKGT